MPAPDLRCECARSKTTTVCSGSAQGNSRGQATNATADYPYAHVLRSIKALPSHGDRRLGRPVPPGDQLQDRIPSSHVADPTVDQDHRLPIAQLNVG